jgi:acyl-coenzyme A thioesterase PaaI-like protein
MVKRAISRGTLMRSLSLQEQYSPSGICFGCGQNNPHGFQLKSYVDGQLLIAEWQPAPYHQAFPGVINGGVIGTLLDCHCNWAAAWFLMQSFNLATPPLTVTAYYNVQLKRPTPLTTLHLEARVSCIKDKRAEVIGNLYADEKICASCEGLFVIAPPSHPATESTRKHS